MGKILLSSTGWYGIRQIVEGSNCVSFLLLCSKWAQTWGLKKKKNSCCLILAISQESGHTHWILCLGFCQAEITMLAENKVSPEDPLLSSCDCCRIYFLRFRAKFSIFLLSGVIISYQRLLCSPCCMTPSTGPLTAWQLLQNQHLTEREREREILFTYC